VERVLVLMRVRDDLLRDRINQLAKSAGLSRVAHGLQVAVVSLTSSIGPPGSASVIAIPATNGARLNCAYSSCWQSALLVVTFCSILAGGRSLRGPTHYSGL
jgi:hypothetical protein